MESLAKFASRSKLLVMEMLRERSSRYHADSIETFSRLAKLNFDRLKSLPSTHQTSHWKAAFQRLLDDYESKVLQRLAKIPRGDHEAAKQTVYSIGKEALPILIEQAKELESM